MFYEWNGYKLRLDAKRVVDLEIYLGNKSPLSLFAAGPKTLPSLKDMLMVLHFSLQPLQHGIKIENTYDIYDKWVEEGHSMMELLPAIVETYKASGLLPREDEVKN